MEEITVRRWHRNAGILMVALFILQAGTGLLLTVMEEEESPPAYGDPVGGHGHDDLDERRDEGPGESGAGEHEQESVFGEALEFIHKGGGFPGVTYRIVTGVGLLWMSVSGIWIYRNLVSRKRKRGGGGGQTHL